MGVRPTAARRAALVASVVGLLLLADQAHAFRCGNRIVTKGDHAVEVLERCGEPTYRQTRPAYTGFRYGTRFGLGIHYAEEILVEEWTYNFGPHRLMRVLRIEDGIVTAIRHLGYGYLGN
jgi:hypothetical protein